MLVMADFDERPGARAEDGPMIQLQSDLITYLRKWCTLRIVIHWGAYLISAFPASQLQKARPPPGA